MEDLRIRTPDLARFWGKELSLSRPIPNLHGESLEDGAVLNSFDVVDGEADQEVHDDD